MIIYTGGFLYISRVKVRPDDNVESWISHSTNTPKHHNCGSREHGKVLLQTENKSWPATKSVTKVIFHSIWMIGQMSTLLIGTIYYYYNYYFSAPSLWTPTPESWLMLIWLAAPDWDHDLQIAAQIISNQGLIVQVPSCSVMALWSSWKVHITVIQTLSIRITLLTKILKLTE